MKILLLGKNGQLGWELQRSLAPLGQLISLGREPGGDLENIDSLRDTVKTISPDIIVNAAAYTAVDKAEENKEKAGLVNSEAVKVLAEEARKLDAILIHYSTDYVFSGGGNSFWSESDVTNPLNYYGYSKLQGEKFIEFESCKHLIFRTSWVYSVRGHSFPKTMMKLALERKELNIISDQFGAPTGAELLADVTAHAIRSTVSDFDLCGLYHVAPQGVVSWYEYAKFVIESARTDKFIVEGINPILTADYSTLAERPLNSRLNCQKLSDNFNLNLPDWQDGVLRMLAELRINEKS